MIPPCATRIRTAVVAAAVAIVFALTASPAAAKSYFAERFDSLIRVMPGGALEVTETVVFRFESGTFDHVFRELPTPPDGRHRDRPREHGRPPVPGWRPASIGSRSRATPRCGCSGGSRRSPSPRTSSSSPTSRAASSGRLPDADVLEWRALPREHRYRIDASAIEFVLPARRPQPASAPPRPTNATHRLDGTVTVTSSAVRTT